MKKLRPGLYAAAVKRADLETAITITVEKADSENTYHPGYNGLWRWEYEATMPSGQTYQDSTGWKYHTKREAMAVAVEFAQTCRHDSRWGLTIS